MNGEDRHQYHHQGICLLVVRVVPVQLDHRETAFVSLPIYEDQLTVNV